MNWVSWLLLHGTFFKITPICPSKDFSQYLNTSLKDYAYFLKTWLREMKFKDLLNEANSCGWMCIFPNIEKQISSLQHKNTVVLYSLLCSEEIFSQPSEVLTFLSVPFFVSRKNRERVLLPKYKSCSKGHP